MNSLAQSGHRAEVFTAEVQDWQPAAAHEDQCASPAQLVRNLSGHDDVSQAVDSLHDSVRTDAGLAVWRAINDQRTVVISELAATEAQKYHPAHFFAGCSNCCGIHDESSWRCISMRSE